MRAGLRYNFVKNSPVATLDVRIKFPTGTFSNDAEVVPVGEGQWDLDLAAEVAQSFWPRPFYVNGRVGYRFRGPNDESGIDFGDEVFWLVEGGYTINDRIGLKMVARGLHGKEGTSFGISIQTLKREAVYLEPGLMIQASPSWFVELAVPFTVSGLTGPRGRCSPSSSRRSSEAPPATQLAAIAVPAPRVRRALLDVGELGQAEEAAETGLAKNPESAGSVRTLHPGRHLQPLLQGLSRITTPRKC